MNNIKAIIFDFDGTIVDSVSIWKNIINPKIFKQYNLPIDSEHGFPIELISLNSDGIANYLINNFGAKTTPQKFKEDWISFALEYIDSISTPKEGVLEFIKHAYENNVVLGIATNNYKEIVVESLEKNNMLHYFQEIVSECDVERLKPYPDVYLQCVDKLGVNKDECLAFEDTLTGMSAAKAAGLKVFGVLDEKNSSGDMIKEYCNGFINDYYEAFDILKIRKIS